MKMNKLILGTVQMGLDYGINNTTGKISLTDSFTILRAAAEAGITHLDTAEAYGDAHTIIGSFHRENPDVKFEVITKLPAAINEQDIEVRIQKYLQDLNVLKLDTLMFHSFDSYLGSKKTFDVLNRFKREGIFKNLGVSIYHNSQVEVLINDDNVDLIQLPFNLLDNKQQRGDVIREAKRHNKIIHSRSAFLQGLFFKDPNVNEPVVSALAEQLTEVQAIGKSSEFSIFELALGYCLQYEGIDSVIIGVDSVEQLNKNTAVRNLKIDDEIINRINQIKTTDKDLLNPSLWNNIALAQSTTRRN